MELTDKVLEIAKSTLNNPKGKLENPTMIQMMGAPSWGKTYLAEKIVMEVPIVHISGDKLRKKIFPQAEFSEEENRFLYDEVVERLVKDLSEEGQSIIIDANVNRKMYRRKNIALAVELGFRPLTILVKCSDKTAKERLNERRKNPWKLVQRNEYVVPAEAYDMIKKEIEFPGLFEKSFNFNSEKDESKKFKRLIKYLTK